MALNPSNSSNLEQLALKGLSCMAYAEQLVSAGQVMSSSHRQQSGQDKTVMIVLCVLAVSTIDIRVSDYSVMMMMMMMMMCLVRGCLTAMIL